MTSDRINQANGRLRAAKVGVTIQQLGNRLYLKATLPPKPGAAKTRHHQQRIALGIHANPAGISLAEKEARKVGALLDCGEFSWAPYLSLPTSDSSPGTAAYWVQKFEAEFRNSVAEITWETEYEAVFRQLQLDQPLTPDLLRTAIDRTSPNSRHRRRYCTSLGKLARFAGLECDFKSLQGNYSAKQVDPRSLPTDAAIAQLWHSFKNPAWRWVYGMIATYGLRSHEVFYLDSQDFEKGKSDMIIVLEGKTGGRLVWPFYPEWIDQFELRRKLLPAISGRKHSDYTNKVSKYFYEHPELTFTALDLRHCWAVRTLEFGLDVSLAAKQMGHSVKVHHETYHHWISGDVHQRAYKILLANPARPQPPKILA